MKPFNLDEYLKNPERKVVTRDGRDVRILCTDFNNEKYPIVGEIQGNGNPETFTKEGLFYEWTQDIDDLFFASEKHEGWAAIYGKFLAGEIYSTKEEAEESVKRCGTEDVTPIAKIEWEE